MHDDVTIYDLKCIIAVAQEGSGRQAEIPNLLRLSLLG